MRMTDLDDACRSSLYVLCEDTRALGDMQIRYRLYAMLAANERSRFFVSVAEEGEKNGRLVPRESLEEAAALYRTMLRATVAPCHFLEIAEDLDKERYGIY